MSQISTENEDNRSVAASDFVQLDQPDEMPDQEEQHPHLGLHQNALDWTMDTGKGSSPYNYGNELKEHKLIIGNLEAKNQTLQAKVENLELKAQIRALQENAEQKANYQDGSSTASRRGRSSRSWRDKNGKRMRGGVKQREKQQKRQRQQEQQQQTVVEKPPPEIVLGAGLSGNEI